MVGSYTSDEAQLKAIKRIRELDDQIGKIHATLAPDIVRG
jgi:hypothetical protein